MLQNIRNNIQGLVAKVIVALIVIPFAIFGIDALVGGGGPVEAAKVNGEKITQAELQQAMNVQRSQILAKMGDNVSPDMLDESKLRGPALDSLIAQSLLHQRADQLGLVMPEPVVDQQILSMGAFKEDDKFSPQRYQMVLSNQGYTPRYFKQVLRQEMLVSQLHAGLSDSEFVTAKDIQTVAGLLQQQRSFNYLTIPLAALADKIVPDSKDIEAYYQKHQDQYLNPERVKLDYIELNAKDYAPPLDEASLKAEYDREMASAKPVTERRAAHILIEINAKRDEKQARELADSIEKKLAAGEDFAKLAEQYSDDLGSKNSGGDLGMSEGSAFPPLFEKTLATMKAGEVSAPIKTEDGFELLKLKSAQTKPLPTFAEKKDEIAERMMRESAQPKLLKAVERLRDLAFNSDGLKGPAAELKVQVKESDWLEKTNKDPLFGNDKIMTAAFGDDVLKDHNNSDVIELSPDHYIVVHVNQYAAAAPKPLDSVKDEVTAALKRERAGEQAKQIATGISQKLAEGEEFKKAADDYPVKTVEKTTRNGGAVAPDLLRTAFAMPRPVAGKPDPVATVNTADSVALLQLTDVVEGQPDSLSEAQRKAVVAQLQRGYGTSDFVAFMENLRANAKIERK